MELLNNEIECMNTVIANRYKIIEKKGQGSIGYVYKGLNLFNEELVAIKFELYDTKFKLLKHETKICKYLENFSMFPSIKWSGIFSKYRYTVFELLGISLEDLLKREQKLQLDLVYIIANQAIDSIQCIHEQNIIHRDIKPDNILINYNKICLADFGTSKIFNGQKSTSYISTRYYRAPECILENEFYDMSIDIWAMGCVFAEILLGKPLFIGTNNSDQLYKIFKILGFPNKEILKTLNPDLDLNNKSIINETSNKLHEIFKDIIMPNHFYTVISSMITLNRYREKPENILKKTFFHDLKIENIL